MNVIKIRAAEFDLAKTLDSGQVFHWEKVGNGFVGTIGDRAVYVEQRKNALTAWTSREKLDGLKPSSLRRLVTSYFALDHPLAEICASFPEDPVMDAARQFCRGLRIIRQPKWECLATFICSSMKQMAHIRQISLALRGRFGATILSWFANHSPAEMGMSGHVHLFVDETDGTYSSDFARASATLW